MAHKIIGNSLVKIITEVVYTMEFFLLFFVLGFAFIVFSGIRGVIKHKSIATFEQYNTLHPDLIRDGKVYCCKCNGKDIYIQNIGHTTSSMLNYHLCRTCGTTLYRSKT